MTEMTNPPGTHRLQSCTEHEDCLVLEVIDPRHMYDPYYAPQHLGEKHHHSVIEWMKRNVPSNVVVT